VIGSLHNFCVQELSSFYLDAIKRPDCIATAKTGIQPSGPKPRVTTCWYGSYAAHSTDSRAHDGRDLRSRADDDQAGIDSILETLAVPTKEALEAIEGNELEVRFAAMLQVRGARVRAFEQWKIANDVKEART